MNETFGPCLLTRRDPAKNMARFYALSIEPSLFGDAALIRHWGRLGTRGQQKISLYVTRKDAQIAFERMRRSKLKRGYLIEI